MKEIKLYPALIALVCALNLLSSCTKDTDLLLEAVLEDPEEIVQENDSPSSGQGEGSTAENPNMSNTNKINGSYYPTSAADISDASRANFKAIITNSFDCSSCVFAANQTIEPAGGVINGTNINLNGAYIENNFKQTFSSSTTFNAVYEKSRLSPEIFGGYANDAIDDAKAIDALINNSAFATAKKVGQYIKNAPSAYTRNGSIDWDLNGAKIEVTSNAKFAINTFDKDYLFDMTNISPNIYNGEFDGNDVYGRVFWLRGQSSWRFDNLNIHDWRSTSNARGLFLRAWVYPKSYGFTRGDFTNNKVNNIKSDTDGIANNVNGLSKANWISLFEDGTAEIYHNGNIITNITGDDAEAVYIDHQGSATMNNNVYWYFDNEEYRDCKRRAFKFTVSNVVISNSTFASPGVAQDFYGQAASIGSVFSSYSGQTNKNLVVKNCDFISNGVHTMVGLSITEIENATITNNRFTFSDISNYAGLSLGTGDSSYAGVLKNNTIANNVFTNSYIGLESKFAPQGGALVIEKNTFNYNWSGNNPGNYVGVLRYSAYGNPTIKAPTIFKDNIINYNASSFFNLWTGVVCSLTASIENLTIENVKINYTGSVGVNSAFGYIGTGSNVNANFGNTNIIRNCTINGKSATGSIKVSGGNKSVQIVNSKDDNGNLITVF